MRDRYIVIACGGYEGGIQMWDCTKNELYEYLASEAENQLAYTHPKPIQFLENFSDFDKDDWEGIVVIKGELVVPKPVQVQTAWRIESE